MNVKKRAVIIGAGIAGKMLADELMTFSKSHYQIIGFVDDKKFSKYHKIKKLPVLGKINELKTIVFNNAIDIALIAIPSAQGSLIRRITDECLRAKVVFRIIPRMWEIVQGKVTINPYVIRPVAAEDLLGRAPVKTDNSRLKRVLSKKTIIITGAAGSIGSELAKQVADLSPRRLILLDVWENGLFELREMLNKIGSDCIEYIICNIQDAKKINVIFNSYKPNIVFHAAAFKHVPLMEENPDEAIKNNVLGTKNCVAAADAYGAEKFIFISTDKAVNPKSIMGATKALGEAIVRDYNKNSQTKFSIVRFGNVLDSYGSVVPTFKRQIASGGPVTITHPKMMRFFMTIPEAVQLIIQASKLGQGGEIFVLDMGEPIKIIDLAKTMIRLSGFEPEKDIHLKIIGARKGEKITEEIFSKREMLQKTTHSLLFITKNNSPIQDKQIVGRCDTLISLAEHSKNKQIVAELHELFPTLEQ